jgi:DNA modification methylase
VPDLPYLIHHGDCVEVMAAMAAESVDAVVCDPPYGISFMQSNWDQYTPLRFQEWCQEWATEALRVLKPGGHILAFGSTRTYHRLTCGIEDAGFEIRDSIRWLHATEDLEQAALQGGDATGSLAWVYASGFP